VRLVTPPNEQVTALQIAALKRLGKGSKVLLLDRYGNASKTVARELARRGFGRVYVVAGAGFNSAALRVWCCRRAGRAVCASCSSLTAHPSVLHAAATGGFDGRGGWVQSKLLVKPTATQYVSSSPLPAALARTLSTRTESTRGRKALPAPSK
jgi:hypothetical protein